jgi:hypothetical protein
MPFTVTHGDSGIQRRPFDAYLGLLGRRGTDWSNAPRVPEPGNSSRWLHVWADRRKAEKFCEELKRETLDDQWTVRELPAGTDITHGPLSRVLILMRRYSLGASFSLHPHSQTLIQRRFSQARPVSSISIDWKTPADLDQEPGSFWDHLAVLLTGLSTDDLGTLEGYEIYDLRAEQPIHDSQAALAV